MADYQESIRKEITSRRGGNIFGGIRAEIGRIKDPELRIVLEHMLTGIDGEFDALWGLMDRIGQEDIATKTVEKKVESPANQDTEYTETSRVTQTSSREVATDDELYVVTVEDTVTTKISLKGNKGGKLTLKFS